MSYEPAKRLLNSKVALEVLETLSDGEQKYVKEIAEDLDRSKDSITGYIKLLRHENSIERGKRTRAQYYKISYEGIAEFCVELVTEQLEEIMEQTEDPKWVETTLMNLHEEDANEHVKKFIQNYTQDRISGTEDATISEFFFHKMYNDLDTTFMLHPELQEEKPFARWLRTALSVYIGEGEGEDLIEII